MVQLFKPNANTYAKVSLIMGAVIPFCVFYFGSTITRAPYNTGVGIPRDQPIPFSHRHHAMELGIDCRFCHTSVETSAVAGLPTTEVCMTCHSQIWTNSPLLEPLRKSWETGTPIEWVKVNRVPDFVYFDHSIHINRGINCNTCHGPIQQMTITEKGQTFHMSWCLECHRDPADFMYEWNADESPRQQVFELYKKLMAGEKLTGYEYEIAEGHFKKIPKDKAHQELGESLMETRQINKSQLTDCYVCHR
ncbi:MAG TPA: cytochrome c3 family protein [Fimbriimonadaceae bacterium]|nr:cytochrome c3 family protein [Fimbriimonadaceae bacterium]